MTTTTQIRAWWGPACEARADVSLLDAYRALDAKLRKWNYRPRAKVTGAFNCRPITGGTGYSLHAFDPGEPFTFWTGVTVTTAVAVDINWDVNPYGSTLVTDMPREMVDDILSIRTNNGKQVWRWGGDYSGNKDAMHFEVCCSPTDINTGIRMEAVPNKKEEDMSSVIWVLDPEASAPGPHAYHVSGVLAKWLPTIDAVNTAKFLGAIEQADIDHPVGRNVLDGLAAVDGPLRNVISTAMIDVNALADAIAKHANGISDADAAKIAKATVAEIAS